MEHVISYCEWFASNRRNLFITWAIYVALFIAIDVAARSFGL